MDTLATRSETLLSTFWEAGWGTTQQDLREPSEFDFWITIPTTTSRIVGEICKKHKGN